MNSAWLRKLWSVQAALHLLAVAGVLGLPLAGQVRGDTTVNVVSIAGGSSALLGDFSEQTFRQGPVPQVIEDSPFGISGYRPAGVKDSGLMVTSGVVVRDPDHAMGDPPLETVSQAMIRWYRPDANTINVIILLRSDSGNGVRYVANFARITQFPNAFRQRQPDGTFIDATGDALLIREAMLNVYLDGSDTYNGSSLPIASGYSDVAADTVARYGNFPNLHIENLQGIIEVTGPVQTLLLLYNKNMVYGPLGPEQIVFPRLSQNPPPPYGAQALLNKSMGGGSRIRWKDIDPLLMDTLVAPARRENQSGTRMTEYTNIQRVLPGSPLQFVEDDIDNIAMGTGAMLNFVNLIDASFGYAFVGGVAGDMRPNIRVGGYEDSNGNISYPYPITSGAGPDCSLPGNNNQARYSSAPYQTGVINGTYGLWAYANVFSRPEDEFAGSVAAQADIFAALDGDPALVHQEGLLLASELSVERNYYISSITGETVTDGQRVVPIGTAQQVGEPDQDDPNP
jgi:hypothetical protein